MKYNKRAEQLLTDLCEEIDEWKEAAAYWKDLYEKERDENNRVLNERLESSKAGIANALLFALSVKDNEDGSLSIDKSDRKLLAENFK